MLCISKYRKQINEFIKDSEPDFYRESSQELNAPKPSPKKVLHGNWLCSIQENS